MQDCERARVRDRQSGDKAVPETNDRLFPVRLGLLPSSPLQSVSPIGAWTEMEKVRRGSGFKQIDRRTRRGRRRRFVRRFQKVKINWRGRGAQLQFMRRRSFQSVPEPRFAEGRFGSGAELKRHLSVRCPREFDPQRSFRKWVERIQFR